MPNQLPAYTSPANGSSDDDVLDNRPRLAMIGQVGDNEKISRSDKTTVDRDHELPSPISEDLCEQWIRRDAISWCRRATSVR